jgi:acetyl-CoA acetyltransferase
VSAEVLVLDTVRTPLGRHGGALAGLPTSVPGVTVNHKGDATLASTTLGWRLVNPAMPAQWTVPLGEGAEILADKFGIDRDRQDAFAARSHRLAHEGWERGVLAEEVAAVPGTGLERDEGIRPDTTSERLAALEPSFLEGGTVALGHPIGCSGARILGTLARELRRRGGGWGLAAICIGVGQGLAVVLEA